MAKVYITKYALTEGITERELVKGFDSGGMIAVEWPGAVNNVMYFHGRDWYNTRVAAVGRANEMRKKKIASLRKSITKLEALAF